MGDIVLTSPVIRILKQQLPEAELHFVCKEVFAPLVMSNPHVQKVHRFKKDVPEVYEELKNENFDLLIDLHRNLRSLRLKRFLGVSSFSFDKINLRKFLAVNLKLLKLLPDKHIVQRYADTVMPLGVKLDGKGLDCFIAPQDQVNANQVFFKGTPTRFLALVIGGSYYTKKIPLNKLEEIIRLSPFPIVLMGGPEDAAMAKELQSKFPEIKNACGGFSIMQSASIVQQAEWVITSDTGLMHLASAFQKKIISVWGNTIPEFGMYPYQPAEGSRLLEVRDLPCRPCSKLGYAQCPLGHFKCMQEIDYSFVSSLS